jgi:RNA polymerase sigma-70 factor, ECF subfamily
MQQEKYFIEILDRYKASIKRICSSYENNIEKAQELYQEVIASIWNSLKIYKGDCSEKTWVFRITYNKAISHVHKEAHSSSFNFLSIEEAGNLSCRDDLSLLVENRDLLKQISLIIQKLKAVDRQIFTLYLEGFTQIEIAAVSGHSESNVSTKVSRIKSLINSLNERELS